MTDLDAYRRRSKAARAVLGIYRAVRDSRCGTLSAAYVVCVLSKLRKPRFGESTVQHAITELQRIRDLDGLPPLVWTGDKTSTGARILRAR